MVQVDRGIFNGHVYNLQTSSGAYVANGIVTHNCSYRYVYNLRDLPPDMLTRKGKAELARVQGLEEVRSARTARADLDSRADADPASALDKALNLDRLGYLTGVAAIRTVPDVDEWHASYLPDQDEIQLQEKFHLQPYDTQFRVWLHEAGHRGQERDPDLFAEFKRQRLGDIELFKEIANPVHLKDYERTGKVDGLASEVFAESYARAMIGKSLPPELQAFWDGVVAKGRQGRATRFFDQREAEYTSAWPNRITRCQRCTMFVRIIAGAAKNACAAVSGPISAHGHCKLFEIGQPESG